MTPYSVLVDIINIIRADYVDVLLSLKDPPRILICDCPDRIAANLKNRAPSLLGPNNGMICEPIVLELGRFSPTNGVQRK